MLVVLLVMLLAALFVVAGCTSDDGAADQIHGTWLWEEYSAYENYGEDGTWAVWLNADLVGDPHDWGTRTFDGETLTTYNAEDTICPGAVAMWTVECSEDGQQARMAFVEASCTAAGVVRGQDRVFVRQAP